MSFQVVYNGATFGVVSDVIETEISCQLDMNGVKAPGKEVWFILSGEGFVLKCGFHLGQLKCRSTAAIMSSSVMNSLFHQLFRLLYLAAKAYKAPIMKKCLKINQKIDIHVVRGLYLHEVADTLRRIVVITP